MPRHIHTYPIDDAADFKKRLLSFYRNEEYLVYLETNSSENTSTQYDALLAVGKLDSIESSWDNAWEKLATFGREQADWIFGYLGYDLKNDLEDLLSNNDDLVEFPDLLFFVPKLVLEVGSDHVNIHYLAKDSENLDHLVGEILVHQSAESINSSNSKTALQPTDSKKEYIEKVTQFLNHIHRGDIYEANFCTAFTAVGVELDSVELFHYLNEISKPPFAALARLGDYHITSASPERFIRKTVSHVISQPIKGTARRSSNAVQDRDLIERLKNDSKEQSENVMIVDLVRNDLSRTARKGSVNVSEFLKIYTFKQVHQMISTVASELDEQYNIMDLLKTTFPMGSMTGAPKISAMKIIEQTESFKRGPYSGALGYISPERNCDFNVLIRSVFYNSALKKLMLGVGSAITAQAIPEYEYEECQIKAAALFEALEQQGIVYAG